MYPPVRKPTKITAPSVPATVMVRLIASSVSLAIAPVESKSSTLTNVCINLPSTSDCVRERINPRSFNRPNVSRSYRSP